MTTLTPPRSTPERRTSAAAAGSTPSEVRAGDFVRSVHEFLSMARRAYRAGRVYEAARTETARRRALKDFVATLDRPA
jgi:hypothetical protein